MFVPTIRFSFHCQYQTKKLMYLYSVVIDIDIIVIQAQIKKNISVNGLLIRLHKNDLVPY